MMKGEIYMKKSGIFIVFFVLTLFTASTVFAKKECPQPRKTKSAPASFKKMDKTARANLANGKKLYNKTAKPMFCANCHGKKGDGKGKVGKLYKSPKAPRNFTCKKTMAKISNGQMFWIIKNGSKGTGMVAHKKTLNDKAICDVIKFIKKEFGK